MQFVITNDDGYGEPGLEVLADAVRGIGQVTIVAPRDPQSGIGHRVNMKTPLRVARGDNDHFMVDGAPADCSRLAIKSLVHDVDWLLAGVNPGANLGSDVYQSGTVAAAREAAILGVKAVAVSQYIGPDMDLNWEATADQVSKILPVVLNEPLEAGQFWNINLPSSIAVGSHVDHRFCPLDRHPHHYRFRKDNDTYHYEGVIHDRPRSAGSDVDICFGGRISITRMEI